LQLEGKAAHATITVFPTYFGSMIAVVRTLPSFSALTLLVRCQEAHLACKNFLLQNPLFPIEETI